MFASCDVCRRDSTLVKEEIKAFLGNRRISQAVVAQVTGQSLITLLPQFIKYLCSINHQQSYNVSLWAGHCTVINIKIHTVHETCLEQLSGHNCVIKFAHCLVSFFIAGTIGYLQKYIPIVFQGCLLLEQQRRFISIFTNTFLKWYLLTLVHINALL